MIISNVRKTKVLMKVLGCYLVVYGSTLLYRHIEIKYQMCFSKAQIMDLHVKWHRSLKKGFGKLIDERT